MVEVLRVVGAVIERDGKILACRRRPQKAEGGKWEFPGGKLEPEEAPEQALLRELTEELDLHDAQILGLVERKTTKSNGTLIDLACYHVKVLCPPRASTDHDSLRWCTVDQLSALDWAPADWPIVESLISAHSQSQVPHEETHHANR